MNTVRAIMRWSGDRVSVLCPMGHLIDSFELGPNSAGSMIHVDVVAHQNGHETRWDRAAARCDGKGHQTLEGM